MACGGGIKQRHYTVSTAASGGGSACPAMNRETQSTVCNTAACSASPSPPATVNCAGSWGAWGACTDRCGGGTKDRYYTITTAPSGGGSACPAYDRASESMACNTAACPPGPPPPSPLPETRPAGDSDASATREEVPAREAERTPAAAGARAPVRRGDSIEPRPKKRIESSLTIAADIAAISAGTPARTAFESDFRTTMAASLGASVAAEDIVINGITSGGAGRRRLQSGSITVDFSILADEEQAAAAHTAATSLQTSTTPLSLTIAGQTVAVTPSTAMAPPSTPVVADLDCEGTWACDATSCSVSFTRTQAQSGNGADCLDAPTCVCNATPAAAAPDEGGGGAVVVIGAIVGALVLCGGGFCCYARRSSSVSHTTIVQQPARSDRASQSPGAKRSGRQATQQAPSVPRVGTRVQTYSKTKDIWCEGRVVKIVNNEAVEVAYTVSRSDSKERRKTLRIDSENLAWGAKP